MSKLLWGIYGDFPPKRDSSRLCFEFKNKIMAQSRLEKIGTIYTRARGLLQSGATKWEDRPLWYDIYEAFPPKDEPRFDRPAANIPLKKIFYAEDRIRALFHQNNKRIGAVNLNDSKFKTLTQRFIECYTKIEGQYGGTVSEKQIYEEAIVMLKGDQVVKTEDVSLSSTFKAAEEQQTVKLKISDLFK